MELTINTLDALTGNALTVDAIVIGVNIFSNTNTATATVEDNNAESITVGLAGYHTYNMDISNVYIDDKTIYINMVPDVTNINDPNYNKPFPMHFFFQDPCSFNVDYYNASNYPGEITWYINNQELSTSNTKGVAEFCSPGNYQLKVRGTVSLTLGDVCPVTSNTWDRQWATTSNAAFLLPGQEVGAGETGNIVAGHIAPIDTYLAIDVITNLKEDEFRPELVINTNSISQLDECCFVKDEEITITPSVTINKGTADDYNVIWEIVNPLGLVILSQTTSIATSSAINLTELGSYILNLKVRQLSTGIEVSQTKMIETCNFITFDYVSCNNYKIHNRSLDNTVTVNIQSIDSQQFDDFDLEPQTSKDITFTESNLYKVDILNDSVTETYIISNYCNIEKCLSDYILNILCPGDTSGICPDTVELNQLLMLHYSYFMELHKEYGINNFYTGLDDSQLERLGNIKQIMDRILMVCERKSCNTLFNSNCPTCK